MVGALCNNTKSEKHSVDFIFSPPTNIISAYAQGADSPLFILYEPGICYDYNKCSSN